MPCPFCQLDSSRFVAQNEMAVAIRDAYPVSRGHTLVMPRRHVASWFDASIDDRLAMLALVDEMRSALDAEHHPQGYNIGINDNEAAGQTVMHLHIHLIPRFTGDVDDPAGGVRFVIPKRGNYRRIGHIPRAKQ